MLRLVALAAALVFAAPLVFLLQQAVTFGPPVLDALLDASALGPALRSLLLGTAVAVVTAVIGSGCAWLVTRTDLPLAPAWRLLLALPLVLPSYIGAFTLRAALSPGGLTDVVVGVSLPRVEGFAAALGVLSLLTYPYVYLLVAARLRQLPANLEEQARVLGSTPAAVVRRVVVPQVAPAVLAGALLVFLYVVSDFGAVQLLRYDTLTRAIFANLLDRPASTAYGLQLALLALVVVVGERAAAARVRRLGSGSSPRGTTGLVWSLGRLRTPAVALLGALAVGALLAPLTVLAYWAGRGIVLGEQRASSVLADPAQLLAPLAGSATAGVLAALAATVLVLPVAYLVARHRGRAPAVSNALVVSGFALPGLVIALACAFFALRGPAVAAWLYQSLPLLLLAYVVHFGAQSLRAAQVGIAAVPRSLGDAARTLGAGRLRRFLRVELPLAAPSLLAGAGLVLLSVLKELPATLLLAPPGFRTLATDVWAATEDAFWAEASVLALVLVALSAVLTWLLVLRRADALS
ncbi:MAG: ABC transporter permease subunit [Actinobacteria bacterium]|nr:ABC transporter permease subunit [Actinomycetota bacterium]